METIYYAGTAQIGTKVSWWIEKLRIFEETPTYFIVNYERQDHRFIVAKDNLDKPTREYHTTRENALAHLKFRTQTNLKNTKELMQGYQETLYDIEKEMGSK